MLLWVSIAILVIGVVGVWIYNHTEIYSNAFDCISYITLLVGIFAAGASVVALLINYCGVDGYVSAMHTRYETLVYQYENNIYDNDNDLGKRELIVDIQNWNEDLAARKEDQYDFWIGVYIPNIYDQFNFIDLDAKE